MPKLRKKIIKSIEEYVANIEIIRNNFKGPLWYRGCGKISYQLKPSLYRHNNSQNIEDLIRLEKFLLERFRQRSIPFHSRQIADPWEWLFLMQHYGVPTRLLDWSESPLLALFFAVTCTHHTLGASGKPLFSDDAAIWILNPSKWNKHSIDLRSFEPSVLTTDDANSNAYKPIADVKTMKSFPIAIYGTHNSQRIVAQRGVFVCFGKDTRPMEIMFEKEKFPSDCLKKITIKKAQLPDLYEAIMRHGITDSVVFPDLDGLAREIKREFGFEV
jgi:hypothetical protein